jgi:DNA-binding XRE family transcriptional regulator
VNLTREQLIEMRTTFGVSQAAFASTMGMPLRTYEDIERGRAELRPVHSRAAFMAALYLSILSPDKAVTALPEHLWTLVAEVHRKVGAERKRSERGAS